MTVLILSIICFLSLVINILSFIALKKGLEREQKYQKWINDFKDKTTFVYDEMKNIDDKQMFEKDDEVGVIFHGIKDIIETFKEEVK